MFTKLQRNSFVSLAKLYLKAFLISVLFSLNGISFADNHTDPISQNVKKEISSKEVESYLTGKFSPEKHPAFSRVPEKYANRKGYYLRKETLNAFKEMHAAALKDNVNLIIRSASRNFDYQKRIWNRKWSEKRKQFPDSKRRVQDILKYSSMPGTSRHHWGTEIDLNSFNNNWFGSGKGKKLFDWMTNNAHKYGFCRPYSKKNEKRLTGYNEEKWHWSYRPLSKEMLKDAETALADNKIRGFSGSEHAEGLSIVKNYIFGIHPSCR